jgi:uncharacterized membrane protein YuzA (DUF378 family)
MGSNERRKIKMHMFFMSLVIIGSINWGAHAVGYNIVDILSRKINNIFNSNLPINKIIYLIVGIAGVWLASKRTTWLPFLGKSVLPENLVPLKQNNKPDTVIQISTLPNVKIAYWAALNKGDTTDVTTAYGNYENSGVVMSDGEGNASLAIMNGTGYTLPSGVVLNKHIHYRIIGLPDADGMMGKIETVYY